MAVTVGTVPVNPNGSNEPTAGWTQAHVMDALEKAFYQMGWNSGAQKNGVPIAVLYPGYDINSTTDFNLCVRYDYDTPPRVDGDNIWGRCGGGQVTATSKKTRYFYVTNAGTVSYQIAEEIKTSNNNSVSNNVINLDHNLGENLVSGTELTYNGQGDANAVLGGLSSGNTYYMRRVSDYQISLHDSASNAQDPSGTAGIYTVTASAYNTDPLRFKTIPQTNPTITINRGDQAYFYTHATTDGGDFRLCDFTAGSSYSSDRHYHDTTNNTDSSHGVGGNGTYATPYSWDLTYYIQTEDEPIDPTQIAGVGEKRLYAYGYANTVNATLKGTIIINGVYNNNYGNSNETTYWKYTVSGAAVDAAIGDNAGRTDLKLRIYRDDYSTNAGEVSGILICNEATGWTDGDAFTIPGTAIGGLSPANDIVFGTNAYTSGTNGTPSILTTSLGSGANFFQKHPDGYYGVLRLENDNTGKKFGVTYWGFALSSENMYQLTIASGPDWSYLNRLGKHFKYNTSYEGWFGCFDGDEGLDHQSSPGLTRDNYNNHSWHNYATSAGPTSYPLKIKYYKAQQPQDDNFAVIQFIQTIESQDTPFFTFSLNKGQNFGASIWDLDEVWNGSYAYYSTSDMDSGSTGSQRQNWVDTRYTTPGYHSSNQGPHKEPPNNQSLAREANYGYLRNPDGQYVATTRYVSNIDAYNSNSYDQVYTYFRSSAYDKYSFSDTWEYNYANRLNSVGVGYHKPIKGLPINNSLVPCPFYMPDDYVMIQAEITPGATVFRPGDLITVSTSEEYTIIIADNYTNQTGLDGIANNTANGMIFAARTKG